jgi:hypothetical protein
MADSIAALTGTAIPNYMAGLSYCWNVADVRFRLKQEGKVPILLPTAGMGWPVME